MISEKKSGAPYLNVWFGNFYRPAYDDQAFVAEGMELLKKFGFNSVLLDSKDWEDFRERYAGKPASQFVGMQEFMRIICTRIFVLARRCSGNLL